MDADVCFGVDRRRNYPQRNGSFVPEGDIAYLL